MYTTTAALEIRKQLIDNVSFDITLDMTDILRDPKIFFERLRQHPEFKNLYLNLIRGDSYFLSSNYNIWIPRVEKKDNTVLTFLELILRSRLIEKDDWEETDSLFSSASSSRKIFPDNMFEHPIVQTEFQKMIQEIGKGDINDIKITDILESILDNRLQLPIIKENV